MFVWVFRLLFSVAFIATGYLALSTDPVAGMIESDTTRHAIAFITLPVLSVLAWPTLTLPTQFVGYVALGAGIEVAQGWMDVGRVASTGDWVVDVIAAAGTLCIVGLTRIRETLTQGRNAENV